jgi:hypothetical protein
MLVASREPPGLALYRWDRARNRLVGSEAFLLSAVRPEDVMLGPPLSAGRGAPDLLVKQDNRWLRLRPAAYHSPLLDVHSSWFFLNPDLDTGSLDPADDDLAQWRARFQSISSTGAASRPWWLPPRILGAKADFFLVADLARGTGDGGVSYRLSHPIEKESTVSWVGRLVLLGSLALLAAAALTIGWLRARQRKRKVRAQHIPYVEGPAIDDPNKFFGRTRLIHTIRDGIVHNHFALIGDFRIGKTSLQKQLSFMLQSLEHPQFYFVPIFVDLQHFEPGERSLFHFLAQQLARNIKELKVEQAVLADFQAPLSKVPRRFTSEDLQGDIDVLLAGLPVRDGGRRPILVFQVDEIGLLTADRVSVDALIGLRGIFVTHKQARLILSGPAMPQKDTHDRTSQWWNFIREIAVEPLLPSEARQLIERPVAGLFSFQAGAIDRIIGLSQGRPMDIQRRCIGVLQYRYARGKVSREITVTDVLASEHFQPADPGAKRRNADGI